MEALRRRRERAQQHLRVVLERRLAWWPVKRIWLDLAARLVCMRPCSKEDAPGVLQLAQDPAGRLHGVAEQQKTPSGDANVKGMGGNHLCRHRWM